MRRMDGAHFAVPAVQEILQARVDVDSHIQGRNDRFRVISLRMTRIAANLVNEDELVDT